MGTKNMNYIAIFLTFIIAGIICLSMLLLSSIFGPKKPSKVKNEPFECGVENPAPMSRKIYVKFYIVAMLFILFDIEIIFFYPWAIVLNELKIFGIIEMFVFIGLMLVGYIYIIKKGMLEWK